MICIPALLRVSVVPRPPAITIELAGNRRSVCTAWTLWTGGRGWTADGVNVGGHGVLHKKDHTQR